MPGCRLYEFGGLKRFGFVDPRTQPDPKKKNSHTSHQTCIRLFVTTGNSRVTRSTIKISNLLVKLMVEQ